MPDKDGKLTDAELLRNIQEHERGTHHIEEPANAVVEEDDYPRLDIRATAPMRCFVESCKKVVDNREPWLIVSARGGAIFAHMRCLGMNDAGIYSDPAYLRHIRQRLLEGVRH